MSPVCIHSRFSLHPLTALLSLYDNGSHNVSCFLESRVGVNACTQTLDSGSRCVWRESRMKIPSLVSENKSVRDSLQESRTRKAAVRLSLSRSLLKKEGSWGKIATTPELGAGASCRATCRCSPSRAGTAFPRYASQVRTSRNSFITSMPEKPTKYFLTPGISK
jgi:hypothetical protein